MQGLLNFTWCVEIQVTEALYGTGSNKGGITEGVTEGRNQ